MCCVYVVSYGPTYFIIAIKHNLSHAHTFLNYSPALSPNTKIEHVDTKKTYVEMPGIEPGTFHMQSERSTAELQPHLITIGQLHCIVYR